PSPSGSLPIHDTRWRTSSPTRSGTEGASNRTLGEWFSELERLRCLPHPDESTSTATTATCLDHGIRTCLLRRRRGVPATRIAAGTLSNDKLELRPALRPSRLFRGDRCGAAGAR